jgi:hypothetical protein
MGQYFLVAFTCSLTFETRFCKCLVKAKKKSFALPTGVAAGVARLFLGWQLPPHATPVDPPLSDTHRLLAKTILLEATQIA